MSGMDVHVVHDADGRLLAIAPAAGTLSEAGVELGVVPVPKPGQFAARLTLTDEHHTVGPVALLRDFEIDMSAGSPRLRPRRRDNHGEARS
jgi:hypothetical protein